MLFSEHFSEKHKLPISTIMAELAAEIIYWGSGGIVDVENRRLPLQMSFPVNDHLQVWILLDKSQFQ